MNWYFAVLKKYAVFAGRARRREYWVFILINLLISLVLGVIDKTMGIADEDGWGPFRGIYTLVILLPSIAVTVRRLHDTGRSGWWVLIGLLPCIGAIVLLVFTVDDSQTGENQYGPNPKESTTSAA